MKSRLKKIENNTMLGFYFVALLKELHKCWTLGLFVFIMKLLYSYYLSYKLFGLSVLPRVFFSNSIFKVKIVNKGCVISKAKIPIIFESFILNDATTSIVLQKKSILEIKNTFHIGDGCRILVNKNAKLCFHGKSVENSSGITSQTIILCSVLIEIKAGTIISWGCYITDSSNHKVNGTVYFAPVIINEHVWISEGVTILPDSQIGRGSIVASKSLVKGQFSNNTMIAGVPAIIKRNGISWDI